MEIPCVFRKLFVVVKAGPYGTGVIWCVSHKPEVIVIVCRTCLACNRHIVKLAGCTCTILNNVFHSVCEKPCGAFFNYRTLCGSVVNKYVSVVVKNLCVVNRFNIISAVCNGSVSSTEFYVCNTACNTAQSCRKVGICVDVSVFVCLTVGKCCKSEVIEIFQSKFRSDVFQTLNCHCVDGASDCLTDSHPAVAVCS